MLFSSESPKSVRPSADEPTLMGKFCFDKCVVPGKVTCNLLTLEHARFSPGNRSHSRIGRRIFQSSQPAINRAFVSSSAVNGRQLNRGEVLRFG